MTDFPTAYITGMTRSLRSAVLATESPFSFVQQVQDTGGERWEFSLQLLVEGLGFEAFANSVINKRREFHLALPKATRQISGNPVPVTSAAAAGASTLVLSGIWDGWSPKAGDFISIYQGARHRLHQLTADAPPDGSGVATLQIVPRLRAAVVANTSVQVQAPKVTLRAMGKAPASIGHVVHQFSIEAVEAL